MSRLLKPQVGYSRLLLSDGTELSHTEGVLNVAGDFGGNLQVGGEDVDADNPVHVSLVSPTTLAVTDNNGSLTVDAVDLDIRALDQTVDSVKCYKPTNSDTLVENTSLTANTGTTALDCQYCRYISVAGVVDGAVELEFQISDDNSSWWGTGTKLVITEAGSFHSNFETNFRYVRMMPSANVTTATVVMSCSG